MSVATPELTPVSASTPSSPGAAMLSNLPAVRLEVRHGGRSVPYLFDQVDFLIGAVAGCDLRVPGADLPAVLCLLARHPDGVRLRRLASTQVLLLNGQAVSRAELGDGDRLTIGAIDILVHFAPPAPKDEPPDPRDEEIAAEREELQAERAAMEKERAAWQAERAAQKAAEVPEREKASADLLRREMAVVERDEELVRRVQLLDARAAELDKGKQEIAAARQELNDLRQQLYDRYQERRDRLAGLKESVDKAARKVQEAKRELEAQRDAANTTTAELARLDVECRQAKAKLDADRMAFDDERRTWREGQTDIRTELESRHAELSAREERLASQRQTLEAREQQYRDDVVRFDRRQGDLEARERQIAEQSTLLQSLQAQLQADGADLETQARNLDALRAQAEADAASINEMKREHEARGRQLDQRAAALEGQQTALTTLRGKLERMRDEFRQHDQALEAQRTAHDEIVRATAEKQVRLERQEAELQSQSAALAAERQQVTERQATLALAVGQLSEAQAKLAGEERALVAKTQALDARAAHLAEQEALLRGRLEQVAESQTRLELERQTLRERTVALAQTEQAREALQEQLRRRAEELAAKQKQLHEQLEATQAEQARLAMRDAEFESETRSAREALDARRAALDEQSAEIETRRRELVDLQTIQTRQLEEINTRGRALAEEQRALAEQQTRNQVVCLEQQEQIRRDRETIEALKVQAKNLLLEIPDLELRAGAAVDRLNDAREQHRDHLNELQAFVRQTHDNVAAAHARLRHERAELAQKETDLRRAQDEHRLALVAFRQETTDWQARIGEMERLLKKEDRGLGNRQARIDHQAEQLGETARELAEENALLESQKETVAEQRQDLDNHTVDMRDWYRKKMQQLAGGPRDEDVVAEELVVSDDDPVAPTERDILSIAGPTGGDDQRLAKLLAEHQIVDAAAAHSLLVEARRQRRPLRHVVVASGAATPYQVALLETGHESGLALGPFRVVDRLRQTPYEVIYRAFDPRRGRETLVRHLNDTGDAVLPDEYRQRFAQLVLPDAHVAGTLEVIDIDDRPAVVSEWLSGLPAGDWPPLAAAPGVCYRLLTQAALGLAALHKHGLVHGRLTEHNLLLTREGLLKLCGANEPAWLHNDEPTDAAGDLRRLGQILSNLCSPSGVRKGAKAKPLPKQMIVILERMQADGGYTKIPSLLEDLDAAGNDIPANPEAWDRLLRYVRDHAQPEAMLRQSA